MRTKWTVTPSSDLPTVKPCSQLPQEPFKTLAFLIRIHSMEWSLRHGSLQLQKWHGGSSFLRGNHRNLHFQMLLALDSALCSYICLSCSAFFTKLFLCVSKSKCFQLFKSFPLLTSVWRDKLAYKCPKYQYIRCLQPVLWHNKHAVST